MMEATGFLQNKRRTDSKKCCRNKLVEAQSYINLFNEDWIKCNMSTCRSKVDLEK